MYFVGDAKTADLFEKCLFNLMNNPVFSVDQEKFVELDTFVNTMKRLHVKPGDWYAGLTMLQSIMNTFWDGFLQPIVKRLGWKRIRQDCRDCYFQASRCIRYVYHELIKILMEHYVSEKSADLQSDFESNNVDVSNANFYCYVGRRFGQWIKDQHNSTDKWLRARSFFVRMSNDFFTFIRSYRTDDSVGVEIGYQIFATVIRINGQHRYLERHWRQEE